MVFACPRCHRELTVYPENLICDPCNAKFPVLDGVPVFCELDAFYEGKWAEPDQSQGSLRNWLIKKQRFFVRELAGAKGAVLDLGCGGGWRLLAWNREVVGIDLSRSSLIAAGTIYDHVAAADLKELPFPDETFTFVVSSDVLGHIPLDMKDQVLSEIHRVLRKGGRTLHYVEADGDDPLSRRGKTYPELYQKYFIEPEGHIGLETPAEIATRFRKHGFVPVREIPCYRGLLYVNRFVQYFDNEYKKESRLLSASVAVCKALMRLRVAENLTNVAVTFAMEIGDRVLPASWAGGMLIEYRKQA